MSYNPAAAPQQLAIFNKNKILSLAQQYGDDYTDTSKWPYFFSMGASDKQVGETAFIRSILQLSLLAQDVACSR